MSSSACLLLAPVVQVVAALGMASSSVIAALVLVVAVAASPTTTAMPARDSATQPSPADYVAWPAPSVTDVQVLSVSTDWTAITDPANVAQYCGSPSSQQQSGPPRCNYSSLMLEDNTPLEARSVCPWDYVYETDPLRIPEQIRHARCSCSNCQMEGVQISGCEEQYATFPVIRCEQALPQDTSQKCRMVLQRVAVGCVCAFARLL